MWSSVSWEILGWHEKTMVSIQNEDEVSAVIASHATKDETYILPAAHPSEGVNSDQKKEMQAALVAKMQKGPIMVAAVRHGGFGSSSQALVTQLLSLMAAAFLLTWLLLQTSGLSYTNEGWCFSRPPGSRQVLSSIFPIGIGGASLAHTRQ